MSGPPHSWRRMATGGRQMEDGLRLFLEERGNADKQASIPG